MDQIKRKVGQLLEQLEELELLMGDPSLFDEPERFKEVNRQYAYLSRLRSLWDEQQRVDEELEQAKALLKEESDPQMVEVAQEEIERLQPLSIQLLEKVERALVPPDPLDHRSTILEIRAGTGGDEAALFVGDCVRMYHLYADSRGWTCEVLSASPSERGGFKEFVMAISGPEVYRRLRYEAGGHRVQRVPATEAQGRVHTSVITVAAIPEADEEEQIKLDEKELRIDTMRSSGAGGQHVNTTDSAVRIVHLPTNTMVYCQQERSQIKNREKAMRMLQAKLVEKKRKDKAKKESELRSSQIGSGDRSDRVRTYNFPQNRITDHRIDRTFYNLNLVMEGALDDLIELLVLHFHQELLGSWTP